MSEEPDPFRAVHRARARARAGGVLGAGVALAVGIALVWAIPGNASSSRLTPSSLPADAVVAPASAPAPDDPGAVPPGESVPEPVPEPAPVPETAPPPVAAPPVVPPPAEQPPSEPPVTRIAVSATGHQAEVDQCIWVRMDLGAVAPIVGAHRPCGGEVVLEMQPGDLVELSGEGVDGRYAVTGDRSGYPGQDAAEATAGLVAAVILQTCYPTGGTVRLVTLLPVDTS